MAAMLARDATLLCEFGLAGLVVCLLVRLVRRKQSFPLPPGPPGIPFVGNILLMSPNKGWEDFERWSKTYDSDLISLTGLGQQIIVANTYASSKAVLDRLNLSDRPHSVSMGELAGWNRATVLHYYDDVWKLQRRYLHQVLGTRAGLRKYDDLREGAAARFVKGLIDSPESLEEQCHIYTTDLMLRIAFGYKTIGHDPMIQMAERALGSSSEFTTPGTWLVDVLPILRYLPSWNPFSKLHSAVATEKRNIHTLFDVPFDWVKREIVSTLEDEYEALAYEGGLAAWRASGKPPQSFTGELLSQPDMTPEGELEVKWTAGTFLAAGSHTTTWTMFAFFKLMAAHPGIQRRAQAEIDSVLGAERLPGSVGAERLPVLGDMDRLPVISDMDRLPYTYACCLETMRYHVVAPFGLPHRAMADDAYGGYHIPAGATVFPNLWAISRDESEYPNPHVFNPERFLGEKKQRSPHDWAFGFGRRICPGRMLADESIFIACATALATLDFSPKTRDGRPIPIDLSQMAGLVSLPTPFEYGAKPRSERARALIMNAVMAH